MGSNQPTMVQTTTIILVLLGLLGQIFASPDEAMHQRVKRFFGFFRGRYGTNGGHRRRITPHPGYDEFGCDKGEDWKLLKQNGCKSGETTKARWLGFSGNRYDCVPCNGPKGTPNVPKTPQIPQIPNYAGSSRYMYYSRPLYTYPYYYQRYFG